jgi:hypothetical protein
MYILARNKENIIKNPYLTLFLQCGDYVAVTDPVVS